MTRPRQVFISRSGISPCVRSTLNWLRLPSPLTATPTREPGSYPGLSITLTFQPIAPLSNDEGPGVRVRDARLFPVGHRRFPPPHTWR